jgi:hypothetical protein
VLVSAAIVLDEVDIEYRGAEPENVSTSDGCSSHSAYFASLIDLSKSSAVNDFIGSYGLSTPINETIKS